MSRFRQKKKPLSDPQDSNSTVRLPRDFGVGLVQENRDPGHPQRAHFFHKNPLFCSIRTKIYVQNGQKPVFFSKRGVDLGGVFLEKQTPPFHEKTRNDKEEAESFRSVTLAKRTKYGEVVEGSPAGVV